MKQIRCVKPCTISGQQFAEGDIIPVELIAPGREKSLERIGVLHVATVDDAVPPVEVNTAETMSEKEPEPETEPAVEVEPRGDEESEETQPDKQIKNPKAGKKVQK